jgi:hypothetical protein
MNGRERAVPGKVEADSVLIAVAGQPDPPQRLEHLNAVRADPLVEPVGTERVGEPHRPLPVTAPYGRVGVGDAQVGVYAEAGDQEDVARAVVAGEIAAVVEVAVAGSHVLH